MRLTAGQKLYADALRCPKVSIVIATGPAGSGKTAVACRHGIRHLFDRFCEKLVITKPAVSVDEEHGFLPGDINKKMKPWLMPIMDSFEEEIEKKKITSFINSGKIEIAPIAYMRGRTFKNSFIIADEMQNSTPSQMKMLMTRIGENSKLVITGDMKQHDRRFEQNGLADFLNRFDMVEKESKHIEHVVLTDEDIMRHPVVAEVLDIYESG